MKLQTSIQPRRDGTVKVTGHDRQTYVFERDADGDFSCDVTDEATVVALLAGGLFWPANEADFDAALALANQAEDDEDGDDGEDDDLTEEELAGALPVEANTPPAPSRKKPGPKPKPKAE